MYVFVSEKCVLFFEKSEVIFTKWCFISVLFFDKSAYDHCYFEYFGCNYLETVVVKDLVSGVFLHLNVYS